MSKQNLKNILHQIGNQSVEVDHNKKIVLMNELFDSQNLKTPSPASAKKNRFNFNFGQIVLGSALALAAIVTVVFVNTQNGPIVSPTPDEVQLFTFSGYVQKGPFISGSEVTIQELDKNMLPTGTSYKVNTRSDFGDFEFSQKLRSPYVEVFADGYYFNEVSGELSESILSLRTVTDLSKNPEVNVNILTTLVSDRIKHLVTKENFDFRLAQIQATHEVLEVFNLEEYEIDSFEDLDVSHNETGDAILIAISAILQGDSTVAELSELKAKLTLDLEKDGDIDEVRQLDILYGNAQNVSTVAVRENLINRYNELGLVIEVPPFEKYIKQLVEFDVFSNDPINGQQGIEPDQIITVGFTKEIKSASTDDESIVVFNNGSQLTGSVTVSENLRELKFTPNNPLALSPADESLPLIVFNVTVSSSIESIDGDLMEDDYYFDFSTRRATLLPTPTPLPFDGAVSYLRGYDLYLLDQNGERRITDELEIDRWEPYNWSNDGSRAVFITEQRDTSASGNDKDILWEYIFDANRLIQLGIIDNHGHRRIQFSPDEQKIFIGYRDKGYVYSYQTQSIAMVLDIGEGSHSTYYSEQVWLDNETILAYIPSGLEAFSMEQSGIYSVNVGGTNIVAIFEEIQSNAFSLSNSRDYFAYYSDTDDVVYIMTVADGTTEVLADYSGEANIYLHEIEWSSDDSRLLIQKSGYPGRRIAVYNMDDFSVIHEYPRDDLGTVLLSNSCSVAGASWFTGDEIGIWTSCGGWKVGHSYVIDLSSNTVSEISYNANNIRWVGNR
jgi:hypothetical protein